MYMNVCKFARSVKLHRNNPPPESPAMPHATCATVSPPAVRLAAGILAAGLLAGCGQGQPGGGHGGFPPAQVGVISVAPRTLPVSWEYVGQTTGSKDVEVRARVTGIRRIDVRTVLRGRHAVVEVAGHVRPRRAA